MRPSISGPVTGGVKGRPWSSPQADLASRGYVAEEFFLEGTASAYAPTSPAGLPENGRWDAVVDGAADYRTRILVVRPEKQAAANGTAVVQWLNVSAGYELGTADDDELLSGYVWVGVSAQKVGIDGYPPDAPRYRGRQLPIRPLKQWDRERYATLVHPGDRYSFDVFSQAAAAVRSGAVTGGIAVDRVVATGASQSGSRLTTYINAVHPLVGVFDAFVPTITGGWGAALDDGPPGSARGGVGRSVIATRIRDDITEPVMIVNSECEAVAMHRTRRADDHTFRFWEVAGAPHVVAVVEAPEPRAYGRVDNVLSYRPVLSSAFRAVHRWLVDGVAPPSFPTIEFADDQTIARDEHGNARGGIRLPELAAPIAEYHGRDDDSEGFFTLYGWARPFSQDELRALYPTPGAYADAYRRGADDLIEAGGFRPEDAAGAHEEADRVAAELDL
ncbi:MAG TPA: alpha/beta hydrolase domain-containing protein [Acidimicrobiia bacterium]|nr:alpha/beta hydrolase domain-containing protein [Acidimicrobiia bacterium]